LKAVVAALVAAAGCSRPVATARTTLIEPPAAEEIDAAARFQHRSCSPHLAWLFPGLGQICLGKGVEGGVMAGLAAAEAGTAIAVGVSTEYDSDGDGVSDPLEHPGVVLPLAGLQDLWVYGLADVSITGALASRERFAPRDSLTDLAAAPFNIQVMKRPGVWAGTLAALAVGLGVSFAISDDVDTSEAGDDPNLFGEVVDGEVGYPAGFLAGGTLFTHVAVAEEALFRGFIQSGLARSIGETQGWIAASLIFGVAHLPNAFALPEDERTDYIIYGLPVITAAGAYLGWLYRDGDYSLAPPTAVHFWYDFVLTATLFVIDPKNSIFAPTMMFEF
jgi:membrane protease YdiL (CAAX protease family)